MLLCVAAAALCAAPVSTDRLPREDLVAMREQVAAEGTVVARYRYSGQGMEGTTTLVVDRATGRFVTKSAMGPVQDEEGFDGQRAWNRDVAGGPVPQDSEGKVALAVSQAYRNANLWWRPDRAGAQVETAECGGLKITPRGGTPFEVWFDPQTHLPARLREVRAFGMTTELRFPAYRHEAGTAMPSRIEKISADDPATLETMELASLALSPARPAAAYAMPAADKAPPVLPRGTTTVPFRLLNNHVIVDVRINGAGPFPFMVDTGGHDIVTPGTLEALDIGQSGSAIIGGGGEATATNGYARVDRIELGEAVLEDQTVPALDFSPLPVEGVALGGMLGLEFLRHFVTRIDYGSQTLTLIDPRRFDAPMQASAGEKLDFAFYEHIPQVIGTLDGRKARFNIDTGSRSDVTLTRPFVERWDLRNAYPDGHVMTEGWGAGGATRPYVTRAGALTLGDIPVPRPVAGLSESRRGAFADALYDGNIGSGLLKRFVVTFDYPRQALYLLPLDRPDADTGQLDRTGMWLNLRGDGFEVMDLVPDGPAAVAGLQVGDRVAAVGPYRAGQVSLSDMRRALKLLPVGQAVAVTIERDGRPRTVKLVPRKLIAD